MDYGTYPTFFSYVLSEKLESLLSKAKSCCLSLFSC